MNTLASPSFTPLIAPLGDSALLVRFGTTLSDDANIAAVAFARRLSERVPEGVIEIDPNLVSVLLRYDPDKTDSTRLAGELRLLLSLEAAPGVLAKASHQIAVSFGGEDGPDLEEVATTLHMTPQAFITAHNASPLRVLTTGFAPGFVYCGFHPATLHLPRRPTVRSRVPAGTVLFAAGQTAITSTPIPTGWHVIGRTNFSNFDAAATPPTRLGEGDAIVFTADPS
jgi:KipI family sensor histidine kinase inhibitor